MDATEIARLRGIAWSSVHAGWMLPVLDALEQAQKERDASIDLVKMAAENAEIRGQALRDVVAQRDAARQEIEDLTKARDAAMRRAGSSRAQ